MNFNQQLFFIPISANAEIKKIVEKNCPIDESTVKKILNIYIAQERAENMV